MEYKIEITETLQKVIEVEAETLTEAIVTACVDYKNGDIILDASDCIGFEVNGFKEDKQ